MRHPMRLASLATLLALPALGATRGGEEKFLRGWPLDPDGGIRIHNHLGTVRLIGWSRDSVAVRGTVGRGGSFFGGGTRRGIKFGVETSGGQDATPTTLVAYVPRGATVVLRGASTDIVVEGLTGSVDVSCVTGQVSITGDPSELVAEAMEGGLVISGNPGVLRAKTASASLRWTGTAQEATLGSVSGRVELLLGPIGRARIETISGDVVFDAALRSNADIVIESHSGSVVVRSPAGIPTRISVDAAQVSGDGILTSSGFEGGKRQPPRMIDVGVGKGAAAGAAITVRSFKGTFQLLSPSPPR